MPTDDLHATRLFDGGDWHHDVHVRHDHRVVELTQCRPPCAATRNVDTVLPGLVDATVALYGYQERADHDRPFSPEQDFLALSFDAGVLAVVDTTASWTVRRGIDHHDGDSRAQLVSSGPRLTGCGRDRTDYHVAGSDDVAAYLGVHAATESELVSHCSCLDESSTRLVVEHAVARDLPRVVRRCGSQVHEWFDAAGSPFGIAPCYRRTEVQSVEGVAATTDAADAAPVIPFARNFRGMRGPIGRGFGTRIMRQYMPDALTPSEVRRDITLADERVAEAEAVLVGSGNVAGGLVPGRGVWEEMAQVARATGDATVALRGATGLPTEVLPSLRVGRIASDWPATWLEAATIELDDPMTWYSALQGLVVAGTRVDRDDLRSRSDELIRAGMED